MLFQEVSSYLDIEETGIVVALSSQDTAQFRSLSIFNYAEASDSLISLLCSDIDRGYFILAGYRQNGICCSLFVTERCLILLSFDFSIRRSL